MLWRTKSRLYNWQLVEDEEEFLDGVATELALSEQGEIAQGRLWVALLRAYSVLLYRGLLDRQDRASEELWWPFVWKALRSGISRPEAEDIAQEAVLRLFKYRHQINEPKAFLTWRWQVFRTVWNEYTHANRSEDPLQDAAGTWMHDPIDPIDLAADVERHMVSQELVAVLWTALPDAREREVLLRWFVYEEKIKDIAKQMELKVTQASVIKYRALGRLRNNSAVMDRLRELREDGGTRAADPGADQDDE
jgi:RNA polymerase sigma factor (sigma-70 family)